MSQSLYKVFAAMRGEVSEMTRPEGKPRAYCRRLARQCVFEGADRAEVVRVDDGEVVLAYTPDNAPVARPRADGRCPLQNGNDPVH